MFMRIWSLVGLMIIGGVVAVLAAAAPASGPPGPSKAIAVKDRHAKQLLAHPGVVGAGVGVENGHAVIVALTARDGRAGIPSSLDGVKVLVRASGRIRALSATTARARPSAKPGSPASYWSRPVPIGVSTGRADQCTAGTIAARVTSGGTVYALSANHVYANENDADVGDEVVQPGLYDVKGRNKCVNPPDGAYHLGALSDWVNIDFSTDASNVVDAAIAQSDTSTLGNATPSDGYGTPSSTTTTASLGMAVQKYGRATALTHGTVCLTDLDLDVAYTSGVAHFVDQVGVCNNRGRFSGAGDSGSLIVTDNTSKNPVGLLFAGGGPYTFANPIAAVLSDLGVSIDGS
jgi:hypothetical protein